MKTEETSAAVDTSLSFGTMLDETCGRLESARRRFSFRRIQKLETLLDALEEELNSMLTRAGLAGSGTAPAVISLEGEL